MILTILIAAVLAVGQPVASECDSLSSILAAEGKYAEAVEMAQKGVDAAEKDDDLDMKISCLCTMSTCYVRLGELEKALECIRFVYEADQKNGNPEDLSYDMNMMGAICHSGGRNEEAAEYMQKAVAYARETGEEGRGTLAIRLGNASDISRSLKRFDEAEKFAQEAYDIDLEDGRMDKVAIRLCQLAGCLAANGKTEEAIADYKKSIEGLISAGNKQSLSIAYNELADITKNNQEAIGYLEKAESLALELGSEKELLESKLALSKRLAADNPRQALQYLSDAYALRDSLYSQEKTVEIDRFNVEYKTLEKESQLEKSRSRMKYATAAAVLMALVVLLMTVMLHYLRKSKKEIILKNQELKESLQAVAESERELKKEEPTPTCNIQFTPREMDIIRLSCNGRISKEIASDLGISVKTVDNIKNTIFHKIGIGTTLELVIFAIRNNLDK